LVIGGIGFRFRTAGIRETKDGGKHWYQKTLKNRTGTTGYLFNG
jgi:hypothetical protein